MKWRLRAIVRIHVHCSRGIASPNFKSHGEMKQHVSDMYPTMYLTTFSFKSLRFTRQSEFSLHISHQHVHAHRPPWSQSPFTCGDEYHQNPHSPRTPSQVISPLFLSFLLIWKFPILLVLGLAYHRYDHQRSRLPRCGHHQLLLGLRIPRQIRNDTKATTQGHPPPSLESDCLPPSYP